MGDAQRAEFEELISIVKFKTGKTDAEIATELGYGDNYISIVRARGVPSKFIERIKDKYKDVIKSAGIKVVKHPTKSIMDALQAILARQSVQSKYLAELVAKDQGRPVIDVLNAMDQEEEENLKRLHSKLQ